MFEALILVDTSYMEIRKDTNMIDARAIIAQIKQGKYPSDWYVYSGRGNLGCGAMGWLFAVCIIIWGVTMVSAMNIALFLLLGILTVMCILVALQSHKNAIAKQHSILVLLPEGVVQYYAGKEEYYWLCFANVEHIKLAQETVISGMDGDVSTSFYYWLDVYCTDGRYLQWAIKDFFGDPAIMCKTVMAAYDYYRRNNYFTY